MIIIKAKNRSMIIISMHSHFLLDVVVSNIANLIEVLPIAVIVTQKIIQ